MRVPGESESSGSMSSHSDKCSEEQEYTKGSLNHDVQSPDVTSNAIGGESNKENSASANSLLKNLSEAYYEDFRENISMVEDKSDGSVQLQETSAAGSNGKEENESVKLLKEKLSAALINVSLKDELVKQHAKVAEEAVDGWEKAENEAASMKQQLDAAIQQISALEARSSHLDQALKECVRQLRLAKEEQERKISEAIAEKINEYELSRSKLESRIVELEAQLEASSANSTVLADPGIHLKLEFLERENQALKHALISQSEELEIRTIERDLSTKAAETASKQHLESIKMVAKLESECRKVKALSRKQPSSNKGQKSPSVPSYSIDSVTNSQSDGGEVLSGSEERVNGYKSGEPARSDSWATALMAELDHFKNERSLGRSLPSPSATMDLMDDFLEMERLAAMPENGHQQEVDHPKLESPQYPSTNVETLLREEFKVITCRASELEEKVRKLEAENAELEMASAQSQICLENVQVELIETKMQLEQLEAELQEVNELKMEYESYANDLKLETQAMMSKIESLEAEIDRQRVSTEKLSARCQELENDLHKKDKELELLKDAASSSELEEKEKALAESHQHLEELQIQIKETVMKLEKQDAASRHELQEKESALAETHKCLDELQIQLKEAGITIEKQHAAYKQELEEKEMALGRSQELLDELQSQLKEAAIKLEQLEKELDGANESKQCLLSELANAREEVETTSAKIDSLKAQIEKEQAISAELSAKCEELKKELRQKQQELELQQNAPAYIEQKINQEDLTSATGKLAECQKTIASLGNQLKSLATLEDFLIDTASIPGFSGSAPLITKDGSEMWKLHSNVYLPEKKCDDHLQDPQEGLHTFSKYVEEDVIESSSSSTLFHSTSPEKSGNGFEKLFPMRRS